MRDRRLTQAEFEKEFPEIDLASKIDFGRFRIPDENEFPNSPALLKPFGVAPKNKAIAVWVINKENKSIQVLKIKEYEPSKFEKLQMAVQDIFMGEED